MEEIRMRVKLSEEEKERLEYLKEMFEISNNAKLFRRLLKIRNVYDNLDDVQQLYNTFKAMHMQRLQTKASVEHQLKTLNEEIEVTESRFQQLKDFLASEGVEINDISEEDFQQ